MTKRESVIKATYEILKHYKYSGVATFIFRSMLRERLRVYNDEMISNLEEMLIEYDWILKNNKSKFLLPTKKLFLAAESKLTHLRDDITISSSVKNSS